MDATTITASDENTRNTSITTWANAHDHNDIDATANTLAVGDAAAGNKTIQANNADASKPYIRYDDTNDRWVLSPNGTAIESIVVVTGAAIGHRIFPSTAPLGDMLYANGNSWQLITAGSNGNMLTMDGNIPGWSTTISPDITITSTAATNPQFSITSNETGTSDNIILITSDVASNDDAIWRVDGDGGTFSDSAYSGAGADYAEWFEREGDIEEKDIIGLNLSTGKVRKYEKGDVLIGVYSANPVVVGNRPLIMTDEEMKKEHALVALVGQVAVNMDQVKISEGVVYSQDGVQLGYLLSSKKVFLKIYHGHHR